MDWSGVDCDVFISCLDSHSDGTHSLQKIHWWASDVMLHFSRSNEETNTYILNGLIESTFSAKNKQTKKNNYNIVQPIPLTEKNQKMG